MHQQKTHSSGHVASIEHQGVTWLDVENPDQEVFRKLENEYHLHPVHLHESTQKVQHNQVEREDSYLFFVLHTPLQHARTGKITVSQIGVFLGKDFLITIRSGDSPAVTDLFAQCKRHPEQKAIYFGQSSSYLLYVVISVLLSHISSMADRVEDELDTIEDLVFDAKGSDAQRIGHVRQQIVTLRRVIGPKRQIFQDLTEQIKNFGNKNVAKYYSNNAKTVNRLWEVIEEAKETVEIYKDADFTTSTEQTNRILAVLTLIFTFTIPITVIGTLYGMNIPLPGGLQAGAWTFFGAYTTFGVLVSISLVAALGMYLYFRNKKWF